MGGGRGKPGSDRTVGKGTPEARLQAKQNQGFVGWLTYTPPTYADLSESESCPETAFNHESRLKAVGPKQNGPQVDVEWADVTGKTPITWDRGKHKLRR